MNNQILSAGHLLHRKDVVSHKEDLLKAVLGTGDAIPLDNAGHYMLVRKPYFDDLLQTIKEGKQVKQDLQQKCHLLTLSCVASNKKLELAMIQLHRFKQNQATFEKLVQTLSKRLREAELAIIELSQQLEIEQIRSNNVNSMINKPFVPRIVSSQTASSQTEHQLQQKQLSSHQEEQQKMSEQKVEDQQNHLYEMLRQQLTHYTALFQQKMNQLEKCEFELESWQQQKEQLRQQNQQLKQKVKTVEVEELKTKIWSDNISQLRQKIEQKLKKQQPQQIAQRKGDGWQEAALLRGKLAEFRMQVKKVDEQMQIDEQIGDEGAVVNLVKLTQRIKSIVRAMLVEASLPQ